MCTKPGPCNKHRASIKHWVAGESEQQQQSVNKHHEQRSKVRYQLFFRLRIHGFNYEPEKNFRIKSSVEIDSSKSTVIVFIQRVKIQAFVFVDS